MEVDVARKYLTSEISEGNFLNALVNFPTRNILFFWGFLRACTRLFLSLREVAEYNLCERRDEMKNEEFGELIFSFDHEYGFNPYAGNAGASGSQGGCGGSGGCGGGGGCNGGSGGHNGIAEQPVTDE